MPLKCSNNAQCFCLTKTLEKYKSLFCARESIFAPNLTSTDVMQITDPFHSRLFHFIFVFLAVSAR